MHTGFRKACRTFPLLVVLLAIATGCAEEEIADVGSVTPTPVRTASSPPSTSTDVNSKIDGGSATPAPVATLAPVTQPSPTPTPVGAQGFPIGVQSGPKAIAFQPNQTQPWIVRSDDIVQLDSNGQIRTTYSSGLSQPILIAPDGYSKLWVVSSGSSEIKTLTIGLEGITPSASYALPAVPNGLAVDATEAWLTYGTGTLARLTRPSGAVQNYSLTSPTAIALDATYAWVTGLPDKLYKISRASGAVAATYTVGADPSAVAVDSATGRVWVALGSSKKAAYFGLDGSAQGTVTLPIEPRAMAIDALGRIWIVSPTASTVLSIWGGDKK